VAVPPQSQKPQVSRRLNSQARRRRDDLSYKKQEASGRRPAWAIPILIGYNSELKEDLAC
jgi:hypothetical protein